MKMEFWTKSKVHRDAIAVRSSLLERIEYIVDHADKPKYRAMAMLNIEAGAEFYCPRLGPFTIREFSGLDCTCKTSGEAARKANRILETLVNYLNNTNT